MKRPASATQARTKFGTFAITFGIAFALVYTVLERLNWPVFTFMPVGYKVYFGIYRPLRGEGPPMYWYGWIVLAAVSALVIGLIATRVSDQALRRATFFCCVLGALWPAFLTVLRSFGADWQSLDAEFMNSVWAAAVPALIGHSSHHLFRPVPIRAARVDQLVADRADRRTRRPRLLAPAVLRAIATTYPATRQIGSIPAFRREGRMGARRRGGGVDCGNKTMSTCLAIIFGALAVLLLGQASAQTGAPAGSRADLQDAGKPPPLTLRARIPLPGVYGRIDHYGWDSKRGILIVSALGNDTVEIVNSWKRVHTITGLEHPQASLYVPGVDRIVVSSQSGKLRFYDAETYKLLKTLDFGTDADTDNMRYDPLSKKVYVGYGRGSRGALAIVDPTGMERMEEFKLGSHPESFQLERDGPRIFVNLPDQESIGVIDQKTGTVTKWKIPGHGNTHAMALDEANHRLFTAALQPGRFVVIDTEFGRGGGNPPVRARRRRFVVRCRPKADLCAWVRRHRRVPAGRPRPLRRNCACGGRGRSRQHQLSPQEPHPGQLVHVLAQHAVPGRIGDTAVLRRRLTAWPQARRPHDGCLHGSNQSVQAVAVATGTSEASR